MDNTTHNSSGYTALANAVVEQAVKDYRNALVTLSWDPDNTNAERQRLDCLRFFTREIGLYTGLDGEWIMQEIERELRPKKRIHRKRR